MQPMFTPRPHRPHRPVVSPRRAARLSALACALLCLGAHAQQAAAPASPAPERQVQGKSSNTVIRDTRRIEHITVEDAGSRVDELREGGETKKITVQPKANVPEYDVRPPDNGAGSRTEASGSTGPRSWKVLRF